MSLVDALNEYASSNPVRFHMPGHKGRMSAIDTYGIDITEIDDFDDLHHPDGLIKDIEDRLSRLYSDYPSKFLVNGSTVGILTGVFSLINEGDTVLINRNSHKSIYNALMLRKANIRYFIPKINEFGYFNGVSKEEVEEVISKYPDIKLVILTNPTYEGVYSEIKDIKSLLSSKNIPLMVDAAHGAHLGMGYGEFPINSGADIVVTSLHKTLPFLTQSACLVFKEQYRKRIDFYITCFETSSPSYVFMAAADRALSLLENDGTRLFNRLKNNLNDFYHDTESFNNIKVINSIDKDPSKIIILAKQKERGLNLIEKNLLSDNIHYEMKTRDFILCMASIMNTKEDFTRLLESLKKSDEELNHKNKDKEASISETFNDFPKKQMEIYDAVSKDTISICLEKAKGRVLGDYIDMFPPGIPIAIPGEIIDDGIIALVKNAKKANINIRGLVKDEVLVLK